MPDSHNVVAIHGAPLPAKQVLAKAAEAGMSECVVIGWLEEPDEDGNRFWVSSSYGDVQSAIYAIQQANLKLLELARGIT